MRKSADEAEMVRLYNAHLSIRAVAGLCGCSPKTVHRHLQSAGVERRPAAGNPPPRAAERIEFSHAEVAEITASYPRVSLHELATRYGGVSSDTIARLLRRNHVTVRPRGRTVAAASTMAACIQAVREWHPKGHTVRQIAELAECSVTTVYTAHAQAGLAPNRGTALPPQTELVAAYAEVGSIRALKGRYGISEARLKSALAAVGVPVGPRRVSPAQGQQFRDLAAADVAESEIARRTGWSRGTVRSHLRSRGAARPGRAA
jgi:DNA-binding CsgD family transcriptional regulator